VALLADQPGDVAGAALRRLDLAGEPLARIGRAIAQRAALTAALAGASRASVRARAVRGRHGLELAAAWLAASPDGRRRLEAAHAATGARTALRGDDVIGLGVPAGREVAAVLDALRDAALDGEVTGRGEEEAFVRAWAERTSRKER
jgi:hypothetical protein